jgi:hypothetical protein
LTVVDTAVDGPVDPSVWLTMTQAAERRGVSKQAISKTVGRLVAEGRLSTKAGQGGAKLINIVAFERLVASESDPAQALRNSKVSAAEPPAPSSQASLSPTYMDSRATREAYQAEAARLDIAERLGDLVSKTDISARTTTAFRKLRDRLMMLPGRISDRMVAAPDARAMKALLSGELRKLLEASANELDHLTDETDDGDDDNILDDDPGALGPADQGE